MVKTFTVYTDGACSGNPGNGGYSFVTMGPGIVNYIVTSGHKENTTNNCMELTAIVRSLKEVLSFLSITDRGVITIYSDSAYCVNAIQQYWYKFWKENEWNTKGGTPVKNADLWKEFYSLSMDKRIKSLSVEKVKGHSGNKFNEIADKAAKKAVKCNGKDADR